MVLLQALGADAGSAVGLVLRQAMTMVVGGAVIGGLAGNAAGALATSSTARRAAEAGSYCREALENGEAARLFEALDDSIASGPTGTDVGDIQLLLLA